MTIKERNGGVPEVISMIIDQRGLKQKAVASFCNMSKEQFNAILTGRKLLVPVDIVAIAKALDVTPNDLFHMNKTAT